MRGSRLTAVGEEIDIPQQEALAQQTQQTVDAADRKVSAVAIQMMSLALKALGQRALIAISNLFMLLTGASVFVLWYRAPDDPTIRQITLLGLYAMFVLALNLVKRK